MLKGWQKMKEEKDEFTKQIRPSLISAGFLHS